MLWKHAQLLSTDFAWLPEDVAEVFCALGLRQDPTRQYGSFNEVQLGFNENYQAWLHIQGLCYLQETRSVEEFGIFSQMLAERLCLGCGVQSDETFGLLPPQNRGKRFEATLRLMRLMLVDEPMDVTDDEEQPETRHLFRSRVIKWCTFKEESAQRSHWFQDTCDKRRIRSYSAPSDHVETIKFAPRIICDA